MCSCIKALSIFLVTCDILPYYDFAGIVLYYNTRIRGGAISGFVLILEHCIAT